METRSQPRNASANHTQPRQTPQIELATEQETEDEAPEGYEARLIHLDRAAAETLLRLAGL